MFYSAKKVQTKRNNKLQLKWADGSITNSGGLRTSGKWSVWRTLVSGHRLAKHKVVLLTQISPVTDYSLNTGDWSLAMALLLPRAVSPQERRPSLPTMPLMCLYQCHMEQLLCGTVCAWAKGIFLFLLCPDFISLFICLRLQTGDLGGLEIHLFCYTVHVACYCAFMCRSSLLRHALKYNWAVPFMRDYNIRNSHNPVIKSQYHEFAALYLSKTM